MTQNTMSGPRQEVPLREKALSVLEASREAPSALCLRTAERDYTFADMAAAVRDLEKNFEAPEKGRPVLLTAEQDAGTIARIFLYLEKRQPFLLLSPKLTPGERRALCERADRISEPLPEDCAAVIFTSGTTGEPKPCVITRDALYANAVAVGARLKMARGDIWQLSLSPARIGGLGIVTRSLAYRSAVSAGARFDAASFMRVIDRDQVSIASVVPAMLADILEKSGDFSVPPRLRALLVGGTRCPERLWREAVSHSLPLIATYAMTETASTVALSDASPDPLGRLPLCRPLDGVQMRTEGAEILIKGEMVTPGYWGGEKLSSGWLRTGDFGKLDGQGRLIFAQRRSDLINTAGEKVMPSEVEAALEKIPGIKKALVFGVADEKWGQIVAAVMVPEVPGAVPGNEALTRAISGLLAAYKSPRLIYWSDSLLRTPGGKPQRDPKAYGGLAFERLHYSRLK